MSTMTLWHNPNCSKSRAALALLEARGVAVNIVAYLDKPPSAAAIASVMAMLDTPPHSMVRFGDDLAGRLGLSPDDGRDAAGWAAILAAHPSLIERPIAIALSLGRAAIGRPPEQVLALLPSA